MLLPRSHVSLILDYVIIRKLGIYGTTTSKAASLSSVVAAVVVVIPVDCFFNVAYARQ